MLLITMTPVSSVCLFKFSPHWHLLLVWEVNTGKTCTLEISVNSGSQIIKREYSSMSKMSLLEL